jgi:NAD-dependent DNA ligase
MSELEELEWEQRFLLTAAYSYNTEDNPMLSDEVYDYTVKLLSVMKVRSPKLWEESSVYPEVFKDPEEAWTYTSTHFPTNEEIAGWLTERNKGGDV